MNFKLKQTRGKEFIDLETLENKDLLTNPYGYTLFIENIDITKPIRVYLVFADDYTAVEGTGVKIRSIKVTSKKEFAITLNFLINSFNNRDRRFNLVVSSGTKQIFRTKGFYLVAKDRSFRNKMTNRKKKL